MGVHGASAPGTQGECWGPAGADSLRQRLETALESMVMGDLGDSAPPAFPPKPGLVLDDSGRPPEPLNSVLVLVFGDSGRS